MKKIIFSGSSQTNLKASIGKERLTLQFRVYDKDGNYDNTCETSNATIHLKNLDINIAYEIIKNALMNSPYIDKHFDVED
jgi:hypothetical protein